MVRFPQGGPPLCLPLSRAKPQPAAHTTNSSAHPRAEFDISQSGPDPTFSVIPEIAPPRPAQRLQTANQRPPLLSPRRFHHQGLLPIDSGLMRPPRPAHQPRPVQRQDNKPVSVVPCLPLGCESSRPSSRSSITEPGSARRCASLCCIGPLGSAKKARFLFATH